VLRRIAAISGVAVRAQQHWGALGRYFIWTAASTAVAWLAVHWFFGPAAHLERLALGAIVVALIYAPFNLRRLA